MHVLEKVFSPRSVAVIGVSREEDKPGHVIFRNMLTSAKLGKIKFKLFGVNPFVKEILGVKMYPSVLDIKEDVDLAIVVVPAKVVPKVIEECGAKRIEVAVIISAGFSEVGNVELEELVKEIATKRGVRIVGPNCLGVYDPYSGVDTVFLPYTKKLRDGRELVSTPRPNRGFIAIVSQSGALGLAILDYMAGEGIGVSKFISYGNKVDVDECDVLEYLREDERTRVILMYLENVKRGRKFIEISRQVATKKPVVALKAGRTRAGARAAVSHTGALAGVDEVYEAAFRKSGIIRAYSLEELLDMGKALAYQPPAKGRKIAILTDGGGAGVIAADEAELQGLEVVRLSESTVEKFNKLKRDGALPPFAIVTNPVDLTGSATTEMYEICLKTLLEDKEVDAVVLIALHHIPGIPSIEDLVEKTVKVVKERKKPVVVATIGSSEAVVYLREYYEKFYLPSYPSPERAVRALRALVTYGDYLRRAGVLDEYLRTWKEPSELP
mgnify:CR=1 FL=1